MPIHLDAGTHERLEELRQEWGEPTVGHVIQRLIEGHRAQTPPARAVTGIPGEFGEAAGDEPP